MWLDIRIEGESNIESKNSLHRTQVFGYTN